MLNDAANNLLQTRAKREKTAGLHPNFRVYFSL